MIRRTISGFQLETPNIDSIINVYTEIHGRDWRVIGRRLTDLGLDGMRLHDNQQFLKTGFSYPPIQKSL